MDDPMPTDDAELLRRYAAARDEAAFAELVRRYLGLVYHAARRQLGGEVHAAEDVTQRVFTLLARKAAALREHATLAGWLHTTTRLIAKEMMRTERRRRAREQEAFTMHGTTTVRPAPENDVAWADLRPVIDEALGELDAPDREIVLLRYFADLPHAQIGARLAISENAARMRVERALEKLHVRLARRGVTSTAAALGVVLANQMGVASAALPVGMAASVTSAALAGSAATGLAGSMAGAFAFMSTTKIVAGLAMVVGVAGLGSAFYEWNQAGRSEATVAALRREAEELRAQAAQHAALAREANERAQASEGRVAALQKDLMSARVAVRPAAAQASRPVVLGTAAANPMLSDPEYFCLTGQKYRAELGQKFWLLYKTLNLTPDQITKFEANRTDSNQAMLEIVSSAEARGVSTSDPSVSKLFAEAMAPYESELKSLLGDDGYRQYSLHSRSATALGMLKDLAGNIYRSETPLTTLQGEQLAQAMIQETRSVQKTPGSKTVSYVTDWDAVALQARHVLSPTQLAAFQALLDARKISERMSEITRAAIVPAAPKSGG